MDDNFSDWMDTATDVKQGEWDCEIQGKFMRLTRRGRTRRGGGKRKDKPITDFSRKARYRMLQFAAKIDWSKVGKSLFITLTYPDERVHYDVRRRNDERREFQRLVESYVARQVPTVWRVEWKARLRGIHRGRFAPHVHLLLFGVPYIHFRDVQRFWCDSIRFDGYVRTDVRRAGESEVASLYIAKYCSKVDPSASLVNVPYLERTGRHYGYLRKSLIPLCPRDHIFNLDLNTVRRMRKAASGKLPWYRLDIDGGFSMIGDNAVAIAKIAKKFGIERAMLIDYYFPHEGGAGGE